MPQNIDITSLGGGGGGGGAVTSVNSKTGAVTLNAADVGASATGHTHAVADVTGLQGALDGKSETGHTHSISDVATLQTTLDTKATTAYVDSVAQGITSKKEVKVATTEPITLEGEKTLDGISCVTGDRVLVKEQTNAAENGIYIVNTLTWTRAVDFDAPNEANGAYVFVQQGTTWADTGWVVTSDNIATIGTDAINWSQFSRAGVVQAGTGITKTGNAVLSLDKAYALTSGTGSAYTLELGSSYSSTLAGLEGYSIKLRANRSSSGTITLNVNGLGAIPILTSDANNVGSLQINSVYTVVYNGENFILQGEGGEIRRLSKTIKTIKVDENVLRGEVLEAYYRDYSVSNSMDALAFSLPYTANITALAWSPDGVFLAVGHDVSPFVAVFKRKGNTLTQVAAQSSSGTYPINISWSPDSVSFFVNTNATTSNLRLYRRQLGDTFEIDTIGSSGGGACEWSPTNEYVAVNLTASPWLRFYKRGNTSFTVVTPVTLTETPLGFEWSPTGEYFIIFLANTGVLRIYKRNAGTDTFAQHMEIPINGGVSGIRWSSDNHIAVSTNGTSKLIIIKFNVSSYELLNIPFSITPTRLRWHPSSAYLFSGTTVVKKIGSTLSTFASADFIGELIEWTSDGNYFATAYQGSIRLGYHKTATNPPYLFRKISSFSDEISSLDKVIAVTRQSGSAGSTISASIVVGSNNV